MAKRLLHTLLEETSHLSLAVPPPLDDINMDDELLSQERATTILRKIRQGQQRQSLNFFVSPLLTLLFPMLKIERKPGTNCNLSAHLLSYQVMACPPGILTLSFGSVGSKGRASNWAMRLTQVAGAMRPSKLLRNTLLFATACNIGCLLSFTVPVKVT